VRKHLLEHGWCEEVDPRAHVAMGVQPGCVVVTLEVWRQRGPHLVAQAAVEDPQQVAPNACCSLLLAIVVVGDRQRHKSPLRQVLYRGQHPRCAQTRRSNSAPRSQLSSWRGRSASRCSAVARELVEHHQSENVATFAYVVAQPAGVWGL
jgi:hypothetical protein